MVNGISQTFGAVYVDTVISRTFTVLDGTRVDISKNYVGLVRDTCA